MLKLSVFEFVFRAMPESFIYMFAIYSFSKKIVDKKKYLLSAFLMVICVFVIRMLPINYGVHTILNIIMAIVITCTVSKIDILKSIKASITMIIILFICEGVNVGLLSLILGSKLDKVLSDTVMKTIYGLPSLILFGIIISSYYIILKKRDRLSYV